MADIDHDPTHQLKRIKKDLQLFWQEYRNAAPDIKLRELRRLANTVYLKRTNSLKRFRAVFNKLKPHFPLEASCFVCGNPAIHRHHIVQLQNGGVNSKKNRCSLCEKCHVTIHPWMKVTPTSNSIQSP